MQHTPVSLAFAEIERYIRHDYPHKVNEFYAQMVRYVG